MVVMDIGKLVIVGILSRYLPWSAGVSLAMWWGKEQVHISRFRLIGIVMLGIYENIARVEVLGWRSAWMSSLMVFSWLIGRQYQSRLNWWWYGLAIVGEGVLHFQWQGMILQVLCLAVAEWLSKRFGQQTDIYVKN